MVDAAFWWLIHNCNSSVLFSLHWKIGQ